MKPKLSHFKLLDWHSNWWLVKNTINKNVLLGWRCTIITIFSASLCKNSYRTQIEHPTLLNDSTCNSRKQENSENSTENLVSEEIKPLDNIADLQNNNSACLTFYFKIKEFNFICLQKRLPPRKPYFPPSNGLFSSLLLEFSEQAYAPLML